MVESIHIYFPRRVTDANLEDLFIYLKEREGYTLRYDVLINKEISSYNIGTMAKRVASGIMLSAGNVSAKFAVENDASKPDELSSIVFHLSDDHDFRQKELKVIEDFRNKMLEYLG